MIIGFLTEQSSINTWIQGELQDAPFTVVFDGKADAYVVCAETQEQGAKHLRVFDSQKPVIWIGELADEAKTRGAHQVHPFSDEQDSFTADLLIDSAYELHTCLCQQQANDQPTTPSVMSRIKIPSRAPKQPVTPSQPLPIQPSAPLQDILVREHVLAVGGFRGCGASTVAWNLAALLDARLVEGRTTSSLSKWTGDTTASTHALTTGMKLGTCADSPLTEQDLYPISTLTVVDVGDDVTHPAWTLAKQKLWVSTLDAQWAGALPSTLTKLVVNRVPTGWPMKPEDVWNRAVDLVIPEMGREMLLAGYKREPWILTQSSSVQQEWLLLHRQPHRQASREEEEFVQW